MVLIFAMILLSLVPFHMAYFLIPEIIKASAFFLYEMATRLYEK